MGDIFGHRGGVERAAGMVEIAAVGVAAGAVGHQGHERRFGAVCVDKPRDLRAEDAEIVGRYGLAAGVVGATHASPVPSRAIGCPSGDCTDRTVTAGSTGPSRLTALGLR